MASAMAAHVIWIGQPSGTVSSTMPPSISGRGQKAGTSDEWHRCGPEAHY
jgi:hypothetical protein